MSKGKKPNGEGSIFKLPNGKWKAVVNLGWTPNGKRRRRSRTTKSRADAAAALRDLQNKVDDGDSFVASRLTVGQFLTQWLADVVKPDRSENTFESYRRSIEKHIAPRIGTVLLSKLSPLHVQGMIADMARDGTGSRTKQLAYTTLRVAMGQAQALGQIRENPCTPIPKPTNERKDIKPLTLEESKQLLEETDGTGLHAFYLLALSAGVRQSEMFGLRWEFVDLAAGKIRIEQQAVDISGKVVVRRPKTKASIRTIDVTPAVVDALILHRANLLKRGLAGNPLVFPAAEGGYMRRGTFRTRAWKPLLKRLGIKHRGFHHLRHTYATLALGAGVPVHVVSSVLGHAKPATTLNIYSHVLEQQQSAAKLAMAKLFG